MLLMFITIFARNFNIMMLTLSHQLYMLAVLKRVKKGTEKNYFTIHRLTLLTLDNFNKCNIIKVPMKTVIKCDMSEE